MYQQNSISALSDIMPLVYSFATTAGFTVTGTSGAPLLDVGGTNFLLSSSITGYDHELIWTAQSAPLITSVAKTRSPKLNGTVSVPDVSIPSKVHFFAAQTPEPFFAMVIEYGYNSYRHLYLGSMEQLGTYSGGQVLSGAFFNASTNAGFYPMAYNAVNHQYLFNGVQTGRLAADAGGVLIDHASNPTKFRSFRYPTSSVPIDASTGVEAFGGFKDDINDAYVARGLSTYAGSNILIPVNLYVTSGSSTTATFVPIGSPPGVRLVNMTGIDPETMLTIGSDDWYVFPAFSKKDATAVAKSASGWGAEETSYMVGYAYLAG